MSIVARKRRPITAVAAKIVTGEAGLVWCVDVWVGVMCMFQVGEISKSSKPNHNKDLEQVGEKRPRRQQERREGGRLLNNHFFTVAAAVSAKMFQESRTEWVDGLIEVGRGRGLLVFCPLQGRGNQE